MLQVRGPRIENLWMKGWEKSLANVQKVRLFYFSLYTGKPGNRRKENEAK